MQLNNYQPHLLSMLLIDNNHFKFTSKLFEEGIYDFITRPYIAENVIIRVKQCIKRVDLLIEKNTIERALESSEQRFIRAIRGTNDGMWDWDINSSKVFFSDRWKLTLGYIDSDFPSNYIEWRDLIHPDDVGMAIIEFLNLLENSQSIMDFEYRVLTKNNKYKWIHIRGMASTDSGGNIQFVSGSHTDITDKKQIILARKKLEAQLRQTHKMKALGQLTGGIAHDFNNILASIMGYAELSKELFTDKSPSKLSSYLDEILIASGRARELITQLLTYSRDNGGNSQTLFLPPIVKEVIKLLKSSFPSTINISIKIENHLPEVIVDPIQIEQTIMNHCLNSKEAMNGVGQIKISLSYKALKTTTEVLCASCHEIISGDFVVMSIEDTGCGIQPEVLNKIFDPYVTTKSFGDGPGMGLAVVHGILHQQHGHIAVDSVPNKGTLFELYFPCDIDVKITNDVNNEIITDNNHHQSNILVVDDEKPIANYLGEYLKLHGYQTTVYTDSRAALEQVKKNPELFDLLITDLTMPNLTGLELAEQCSKISSNLLVIVCSGNNISMTQSDYDLVSIKDVISKPFNGNQLLSTVSSVLNQLSRV